MTVVLDDRFKLRRGTAANLATVNEVPLEGEIVYETDQGLLDGKYKVKIGDGSTHYNDLPYVQLGGGVEGIVPGAGIDVDASDPKNPIVSSTLGSIALSGRVATYSALPTSGLTAGNAYLVDADSLVYVWNGSAFPANGSGLSVSGSLVASAVVTGSAATDLTVTGLDLNAHHDYRILVSGKNNNASSFDTYLYFNGDTTNANYGRQSLYGLGSATGAARSTSPVFDTVGASSDFDLVATMVKSPSGWPAVMGAQSAGSYTGLTCTNFVIRRNNSANVTSLTYHASVAGALAIGTEIKVYRR